MNDSLPKIAATVLMLVIWLPIVWLGIKGILGKPTLQLPTMRRVTGKEARLSGAIALLAAVVMAIAFVVVVATGHFNPRW